MQDKIIEKIKPYIKNKEAYLVGGYMRDLMCGKISKDRDIAIKTDNLKELCIKIANELNGHFVELDCENEIYRVVFEEDYIDFAKILNDDLEKDINRRDFTINSIMYDIKNDKVIDKNNGRKDFENKIIRTFSIQNLEDDYLRMLRAFRFQAMYGFKIEENILEFIKENKSKINLVAPERVHQELIKIFEGTFLIETLFKMDEVGFLEELFPCFYEIKQIPKNSHHHLDLFHHSIETVKLIRLNKPELKIAALLHDIAKPDCWTIDPNDGRHRFIGHDELGGKKVVPILKKLKFSNKQIDYISTMIKYHMYPSMLMNQPDKTEKAIIRFIRKINENIPDLIELARSDRLSAKGPMVDDDMINNTLDNLELLLKKYEEISPKLKALPKLIDGVEIMNFLNIKPSKELGDIIEKIKELQFEGKISTKEDVYEFLKTLNG